MRPVLLATATVVGLIVPLAALPAAASASSQATCAGRSYERIDRVTQGGRQANLWKCKGGPYYHAQITGGIAGDRVRVFARDPNTGDKRFSTAFASTDGWANTSARTLADKEEAWVCIRLKGATTSRCSKAHRYLAACDGVETGTTTTTISRSCRL